MYLKRIPLTYSLTRELSCSNKPSTTVKRTVVWWDRWIRPAVRKHRFISRAHVWCSVNSPDRDRVRRLGGW